MTNGEARRIHSGRPLCERRADEKATEILTQDIELWKKDPKMFDMPRVDEKAPLTFHRIEQPAGQGMFLGELRAKDAKGDTVGHVQYVRNKCDLHLSLISVFPEFASKGYGVYLMREFINVQDKECLNSTLEVVPFGIYGPEEIGEAEWNRRFAELKGFYDSFGYDDFGKKREGLMVRKPVCEGKKLKPECEHIDLSLLAQLLEDI
jgi:GNAT superfamily N-acetyltransferase